MRILVTGSSGMLGSQLCAALKGKHGIIGIDLAGPRSAETAPGAFHEGSIADSEFVGSVMGEEKPDLVIHAAAWTDVDGCELDPEKAYDINASGTEMIARQAAAGGKIPVVLISTDFVFDGRKGSPYTEEDAPRPLSVYGRTKLEAEKAVQRISPAHAIVRSSWLFGLNGKNFVDTILAKAGETGRLRVVRDQVGSPTSAKDLAAALDRLIDAGAVSGREIFHVSDSGSCSWYDLAVRVLAEAGGMEDVAVEPISSAELGRPAGRPAFSALDCSKYEKVTGHKMRPWEDALKEYIRERHAERLQ